MRGSTSPDHDFVKIDICLLSGSKVSEQLATADSGNFHNRLQKSRGWTELHGWEKARIGPTQGAGHKMIEHLLRPALRNLDGP
jgi:hypothetical protein